MNKITTLLVGYGKFTDFIDLTKIIKKFGKWIKNWRITTVDVTGIYYNQFNMYRYYINLIHFFYLTIIFINGTLIISNNFLWELFNNDYFPNHTRILTIAALAFTILAISVRFDILIAEWLKLMNFLKFFYYLQENDQSKHRLTKRNYLKISILAKSIEIFVIRFYAIFIVGAVLSAYSLITIKSRNFFLLFITPTAFYSVLMVSSTIAVAIFVAFLSVYYYKLLFDQINHQFETIYKRSLNSVSLIDQMNLIWLVKKHNKIANKLNQFNLAIRRTISVSFIAIALLQIVPLNMHFDSKLLFYKIIYLSSSLSVGFGIGFASSLQISAAHKPAKLINKILCKNKQKFNFTFKWKVI